MKRFLLALMLLISVISFAKVRIIDTKNNGMLTGGRSVEYKDDKGAFIINYEKDTPIEIQIETKNTPSNSENTVGIMVDAGYNFEIPYYVEGKTISIYPGGKDGWKFNRVIEEIEKEKSKQLIYDYINSNGKMVTRVVPLKEIKENIKKLKDRADEPVSAITKRTRGKGADKQVWIEGTGWVYESLIEKDSYKPTENEINEIMRTYNIPEEAAVRYLMDNHKK